MAIAIVSRELFSGYGTLNPGSPGNLGTIEAGAFDKRPIGPNIAGMSTDPNFGWSSLLRGVNNTQWHNYTLASPQTTKGIFTAWYRARHIVTDGTNRVRLPLLLTGGATIASSIAIGANGLINAQEGASVSSVVQNASVTLPLDAWAMICMSWEVSASSVTIDYHWYCPAAGVTSLTRFISRVHGFSSVSHCYGGTAQSGGGSNNNAITGRYALPTLYSCDAKSEISLLTPASELPVEQRTIYRVRPGQPNASDASDGIQSAGRAWATLNRVATALKTGELLGSRIRWWDANTGAALSSATTPTAANYFATGIKNGTIVQNPNDGSTVNIDSDLQHVQNATVSWLETFGTFDWKGIEMKSSIATGLQYGIRGSSVLAGTWTQPDAGTYPNLWQITLPSTPIALGLWEVLSDGTVLATEMHSSASWDTAAAIAVNSTAGKYYFTGANLYYRPLSGSNPNTDGRTRRITINNSDSTYVFQIYGGLVANLKFTETGAVYFSGGVVTHVGGYAVVTESNQSAVHNCISERYGKHAYGDLVKDNGITAWTDCVMKGASIGFYGGSTAHVVYRDNGVSSGSCVMIGVVEQGVMEVRGSSGYTTGLVGWQTLIGHTGSPTGNLDSVILKDCTFLGIINLYDNIPAKLLVATNVQAVSITAPTPLVLPSTDDEIIAEVRLTNRVILEKVS